MELVWQTFSTFGIFSLAAVMCLLGFVLSCLSLSGTWMVLGATGLLAWSRWPNFPSIGTLIFFLALCIAVEVAEALAASWGVQRRGGSKQAGVAALVGGFLGMLCGGLIPIPLIGSLIGMIAGSFALAFFVEHARMKRADHAAHVATGAVLARLGIIFIKVGVTILMIIVLGIGVSVT